MDPDPLYAGKAVAPCMVQPSRVPKYSYKCDTSLYCLDEVPLDGLFDKRGVAPPSSRKLTETPELPPVFVEARAPVKYGARLTAVPLYVPLARIPGTAIPTFGLVSEVQISKYYQCMMCLDLQFPMMTVLTTRVNRVAWLAAVLFIKRAVV